MKQRSLIHVEQLFKALADRTRLRILGLLLTGEVCVCHIQGSLRIPQSKTSRHLAYLRRAGLVETRRQGLWVYYRLADGSDPVVETIRATVTHALGHLDGVRRDLDRLQQKTGCCVPAPTQVRARATPSRLRAGNSNAQDVWPSVEMVK